MESKEVIEGNKNYEYWKKQHDKWNGRLNSRPTEYAYKKWAEAYDKMFELKPTKVNNTQTKTP